MQGFLGIFQLAKIVLHATPNQQGLHGFPWIGSGPEKLQRRFHELRNLQGPVELYAQTVKLLASRNGGLNFAILGAKSDVALAETIVSANPGQCLDLTGRTTLWEMIEWLRLADVVIANDTGPLHVAAALGRPLVPIYGPTDPHSTGPHGQLDRVLQTRDLECVPCMSQTCTWREPLACMKAITPEMVSERTMALLQG